MEQHIVSKQLRNYWSYGNEAVLCQENDLQPRYFHNVCHDLSCNKLRGTRPPLWLCVLRSGPFNAKADIQTSDDLPVPPGSFEWVTAGFRGIQCSVIQSLCWCWNACWCWCWSMLMFMLMLKYPIFSKNWSHVLNFRERTPITSDQPPPPFRSRPRPPNQRSSAARGVRRRSWGRPTGEASWEPKQLSVWRWTEAAPGGV